MAHVPPNTEPRIDPSRTAGRPPPDHPDRAVAANEVHARPTEALEVPLRASYLAITVEPADREREVLHIADLCARFDVAGPTEDNAHFKVTLGQVRMKWERHTEFSAYTFTVPGVTNVPFREPPTTFLPPEWIAALPGRTIVAVHAKLMRAESAEPPARVIADAFGGHEIVASLIGEGAGAAFTDFRIQPDGHVRVVIQDRGLTPRQAGRMLQRLFEIEAYRVMALLALPLARTLAPRINTIERSLGALATAIADQSGHDEVLLAELTQLSAEVERMRNGSAMRLSASAAYHELVVTRIEELRERRLEGFQTVGEFMTRRLNPAMATCRSTSRRMRDLSERVAQASALLSARVEIVRERQNQALLESMDRRARLQLRLQRTVEWLSIAAVTYYVAAVVSYATKALKAVGLHVDVDIVVGLSIPVVVGLVALALHRARLKGERPVVPSAARPLE